MTLPEALAHVKKMQWHAQDYGWMTDAAALTLLLAEAHRAHRLREALASIANSSCCGCCQEAALVARAVLSDEKRCEGRYQVPQTSPPRDEPFEVTYRCGLLAGHTGPHTAVLETPNDG